MILIFLYFEQKQGLEREREREREPFTNNYVDFSAVKCKQKYPEILSDLKKSTKFTIIWKFKVGRKENAVNKRSNFKLAFILVPLSGSEVELLSQSKKLNVCKVAIKSSK